MVKKKVGSITLAVGLITVGAILFAQNFVDISLNDIYKYWPVLLIGLGLEMVLYIVLYGRNNTEVKLSVDGLVIVFIIVLGLISYGVNFVNIDVPGRMFFWDHGSSVIDGIRYRTEINETYNKDNISGGFNLKELQVSNSFGDIKILSTDAKCIKAEAKISVKCNNEGKAREYAKAAIGIKEGEVTELFVKDPDNWNKNDYAKAQIDFVLYVPKEVNVDVKGSFGDINVEDISGKCILKSKYGEIEAVNIDGDIYIDNAFGEIEVSNVRGKADLSNAFGEIKIKKVSGDITVEGKNGEIEAEDIIGNAHIKNSFGDICFRSESINNGDIYARTNFGDIDCEKSLQLKKEGMNTVTQGKLGTGQYKIELITNNGDIIID